MRHIIINYSMLLLLLTAAASNTAAQEERPHVRRGVALLEQERFAEAEAEFRSALQLKPSSFEAAYNLGTALFRQEKYDEALQQLQATTPFANDDKQRLASLFHNLGNSYLFGQNIDQSIEAYKQALRHNPLDDETRYNLIAAMKLKDEQEEQEEEQQEQQEQEQQEQQEQEQEQQEQEQQDQQQQQQQESEGISRENAERLLQALEEDEKELLEKMNQNREKQPVRIEKNW
ncbi:MAG TPA: tetratricopeptide repeat protein [Bacteroidales bacterium]|nr:tetratricopeptide repeat protein [Bacteroidales bacterium]